ncbi:hypothetical protein AB6A40_007143 [Gnathostoma spinigerum]|uniref:Uncharacterized protein n=1 Tax=Gnathostoma spinigerum TaxID=75299 RepID=A0ABD6ET08_9BILA
MSCRNRHPFVAGGICERNNAVDPNRLMDELSDEARNSHSIPTVVNRWLVELFEMKKKVPQGALWASERSEQFSPIPIAWVD